MMTTKILLPTVLLLLLQTPRWSVMGSSQEDLQCLQDVKNSVVDPLGYLSAWNLSDPAFDYCKAVAVTCLHDVVTGLLLSKVSLSGSFPNVGMCKTLNTLDLSYNNFSGPISPTLCTDVPQLVTINLANNQFDGPIPQNFDTCFFLNDLYVQNNDLCGPVPDNLNNKTLPRLKNFVSSGNKLDTNCVGTGTSESHTSSSSSSSNNTALVVGIAIGAMGVLVVVALGVLVYRRYKRRSEYRSSRWNESNWIKAVKAPNLITVSFFEKSPIKRKLTDLMAATDDFSQANLISSGKRGSVYKGTLKDGSVMAIKRLEVTGHTNKEFRAEMETLGKLSHRNLVPLLGYCIAGKERILVYEHMPGGSLQELLNNYFEKGRCQQVPLSDTEADVENGLKSGTETAVRAPLDWQTRLKLAIGTARGLAWLHHSCNPRVLHRNISPSNILLDDNLEPKISNFGLARLMNPVDTHISTFVNGGFGEAGYVAPEYARTLVATIKGDVFSFGVVMLELITGQKATTLKGHKFTLNLAAWVWMLYNSGKAGDSIDKSLIDGVRDDELMQFLKLAISCVHPAPKERPTLYEVFHMLRAIGAKYHLTDENDEIPLAASTADLEASKLSASGKQLADKVSSRV